MKALAITAAVVLGALASVIAWLALWSDPMDGEPVVVVAISRPSSPADRNGAQGPSVAQPELPPPAQRPAINEFELPPGVAVVGLDQPGEPARREFRGPGAAPPPTVSAAPGISIVLPPENQAPPQQNVAPPVTEQPAAQPPTEAPGPGAADQTSPAPSLEANAQRLAPTAPAAGAGDWSGTSLVPAPVADLVEESQYGPLPKIAADGRRPLEVYARPSRHVAAAALGTPARVAVLVNGLGLSEQLTGEAIQALPGEVSVGFSAYSRNAQDWVSKARAAGHEVLLQVPLEPYDYPDNDPGPQTLLTSLPPEENMKRLQWLLSRFTGYVGVTNHMGAKFASTQESFLPILEEFKSRGLLYVDDGTAQRSTAGQIASMLGLDYSVASVQIDASNGTDSIAKNLAKLETIAKERGAAIGVATAKPATVKQIAEWAEQLDAKGIVLVPVSAAVRSQGQS